jgi:hypothetical protein
MNLPLQTFIDYISDNIFSINHKANKKVESEIIERKKAGGQRNKTL